MKEYKKQAMKMQMICFLILLWLFGGVPLSDLVMRMYLKDRSFKGMHCTVKASTTYDSIVCTMYVVIDHAEVCFRSTLRHGSDGFDAFESRSPEY